MLPSFTTGHSALPPLLYRDSLIRFKFFLPQNFFLILLSNLLQWYAVLTSSQEDKWSEVFRIFPTGGRTKKGAHRSFPLFSLPFPADDGSSATFLSDQSDNGPCLAP